jgi:ABC-type uncharacterized transport system permease subunit
MWATARPGADLQQIEVEISVGSSASPDQLSALEQAWLERCRIYLAVLKANDVAVRVLQGERDRVVLGLLPHHPSIEAAEVAGVRTKRIRSLAVLFGGTMGGLSGATLVLAQAGTFAEGMSAGRGFIAIAIVALGRWHPVGIAVAALLFGTAGASQFVFQAMGWPVPYQLFLALPYVLTLIALAHVGARGSAPSALGR